MPTMRQLKAQQEEIERFKRQHEGDEADAALTDISQQMAAEAIGQLDSAGAGHVRHGHGYKRPRVAIVADDAAVKLDAALAAIHASCKHVTVGLSQTQVDALKAVALTPGAGSGGWHNQLDQAIKLYTDMRLGNMPFNEWEDYDIAVADRCHHPGTTDE